jgi:cobalt-zinc-cadmium resistance protein CzcA
MEKIIYFVLRSHLLIGALGALIMAAGWFSATSGCRLTLSRSSWAGCGPALWFLCLFRSQFFFAFIIMNLLGISANLMSLGGLAITIGMMVDASIVMVENVDRLLRAAEPDESRLAVVARGCIEVGRPVIFATAIIVIIFVPLFTLQGVEGKTFRPLAQTVALGMFGSLLYALVPGADDGPSADASALSSKGEVKEALIVRLLLLLYRPLLRLFCPFPRVGRWSCPAS